MDAYKILILLIGFIAISCTQTAKKEGVVITGNFQNAGGTRLTLREFMIDSIHNIDSIKLDDKGLFRFTCKPEDAGFYSLFTASGEYILLLLDKNEEVNIFSDLKKKPFDYSVKGSPGSVLLKDFYDQTLPNLEKADSLRAVLMINRESSSFYQLSLSLDSLFQKLIDDQKLIEKSFINKNSGSLASLIVLNYKFGMNPVLNIEDDFAVFLKLDSALIIKYPANKHVSFHHQRVLEHQRQQKEKESLKKLKF
jgi:hypothetical protein